MLSYAILWPVGSLIEQRLIEKKTFETYDWKKCLRCVATVYICMLHDPFLRKMVDLNFGLFFSSWNRFSMYGALIMGPTMYVWIRIAAAIWPRTDFRSSLSKAITEQFTYDPASICTFMFVMSLLEGKTRVEAVNEVSTLLPLNEIHHRTRKKNPHISRLWFQHAEIFKS